MLEGNAGSLVVPASCARLCSDLKPLQTINTAKTLRLVLDYCKELHDNSEIISIKIPDLISVFDQGSNWTLEQTGFLRSEEGRRKIWKSSRPVKNRPPWE